MASQADVTWALEHIQSANAIRIEIPALTPRASNWAPHRHTPALIMSRVDISNLPLGEFPPRQHPLVDEGDVLDPVTLVLNVYLGGEGEGNLVSDSYAAEFRAGEAKAIPGLVVKMLDIATHPPVTDVFQRFIEEGQLFIRATSVQGVALPRYAGLFASGSVFCHVFDDAGGELPEADMYKQKVQDQVVEAIRLIQETGVSYMISNPSTVRRDAQGRIKINELHWSSILERYTPEVCAEWASRNDELVGKTPEEVFEYRKESDLSAALDEFPPVDEHHISYW